MKKIKSYITNLPKGVKIILSINLIVYLLTIFLDLFSIDLIKYFSVYSFLDPNFHIYQILTSIFTHSYNFDHILINLLFFIFFAPFIERKIETKNFIALYMISGIFSVLLSQYFLTEKYLEYIKLINDINLENSEFKNLDISSVKSDLNHNYLVGASGAIFGIIMVYFLENLLVLRKIGYNIFFLLNFIFTIVVVFTNYDNQSKIGESAHLGGITIGMFYFFTYKTCKKILL